MNAPGNKDGKMNASLANPDRIKKKYISMPKAIAKDKTSF
jgi:hypothetical protein